MTKSKQKNSEKSNIVILGGGFAGVRVALDLYSLLGSNENYEIILVDKRDYQTYYSALYEAATTAHELVKAKKVKSAVTIPFSEIFRRTKIKHFKGFIENVDLENGLITTDSRIINYSYLVFAMGSIADYYGILQLEKYGFTLKSLDDAIMIRNRISHIMSKKDSAQFVVGGGGFAGAEFAGELYNLVKTEAARLKKDHKKYKLMIVEGGIGLLSGLSEKVSKIVTDRILSFGIETRFSTLITKAGKDHVVLNNKEKVDCDLLVWTGGVRSCRLPATGSLERDKKDRTNTTDYLNLKKYPNVFIAGDNLCFSDPETGKPVPQTAQEAIRQGKFVAKNIYRSISDKELIPYVPGPNRFVIPVSGKYAIFYTPNLIISGFFGWVIRKAADLKYFLSILPFAKALGYWFLETTLFNKND